MSVIDVLTYFLLSSAQSWGAITASTNSDALDTTIGGVGLSRVMRAKINYSAASLASGSGTVTFWVQKSTDNSTWYDLTSGADQVITLSTTAQSGEIVLKFSTVDRYIRLRAVFAGSPTTPTITVNSAYLSLDSY